MKTIRRSVFETNSSSMHSLSIIGGDSFNYSLPSRDGVVEVWCGEYGWGYDRLDTPYEKLDYILTASQYHGEHILDYIKEVIKNKLDLDLRVCGEGYIDHQSNDILDDLFESSKEEFMKRVENIIFNNKFSFLIDNDNH